MPSAGVILIVTPFYLPGFKAGGPIQSISSLIKHLDKEFVFRIITRDRDLGDTIQYEGIPTDRWASLDGVSMRYLPPGWRGLLGLRAALKFPGVELVYLNGFFSGYTLAALIMRRLGLIPNRTVLLAPRGEFSPGAFRLKNWKKRAYTMLGTRIGLWRDAVWHASTEQEKTDIDRELRPGGKILVAPNFPTEFGRAVPASAVRDKASGSLRAVFLSRISRKKNLLEALELLGACQGDIVFDIYGHIHDADYWNECQEAISRLSPNVAARFLGPVPHAEVHGTLSKYHLFVFPTRGENYGHVIVEALLAGCLALLSDQTPWRDLTRWNAGWDIPLDQPDLMRDAIASCIKMDQHTFNEWSAAAYTYAVQHAFHEGVLTENRNLLLDALSWSGKPE